MNAEEVVDPDLLHLFKMYSLYIDIFGLLRTKSELLLLITKFSSILVLTILLLYYYYTTNSLY